MRNLITCIIIFITVGSTIIAQVGIGTASPNATAILDIHSTEKGLLPPRMTTAQRNAISTPADGLLIFNTTTGCVNYFFSGVWMEWCGIPPTPVPCNPPNPTAVVEVLNPITGKIWMDRNLGAKRVANSSTDSEAYGDLYQWGRGADGHQCRNSTTTTTVSISNTAGHSFFIINSNNAGDWRYPPNTDLWQGVDGVNNPCPYNFRLPTDAELDEERLSWTINNGQGAFASPLKLPVPGLRWPSGGIQGVGQSGYYWSSNVSGNESKYLEFDLSSGNAQISIWYRASGRSVRCIKN